MTTSLEEQLAIYGDSIDDAVDRQLAGSEPPGTADPPATRDPHAARRLRRMLIGAAAAVAVGVVGGVVALWPGSSSPAWADWTPVAQSVPATEVDAIDSFCRDTTNTDGMDALIFDVRGSGAVAIYGGTTGWVTCHAERQSDGTLRLAATSSNRGDDISLARVAVNAGVPVAVISVGWQGDPAASLIWGVRATAVETIEIATAVDVVDASTSGDIWVGWWTTDDAATALVRGRDAAGAVLADGVAGQLAPALPDRSTITAHVAAGGTELEQEILADGIVTWPEFVTTLDAWRSCVATDGYDLTIEIDDTNRTYRAISPTVTIEAPAGAPDDAAARELLEPIDASITSCRAVHVSRIEQVLVQQ